MAHPGAVAAGASDGKRPAPAPDRPPPRGLRGHRDPRRGAHARRRVAPSVATPVRRRSTGIDRLRAGGPHLRRPSRWHRAPTARNGDERRPADLLARRNQDRLSVAGRRRPDLGRHRGRSRDTRVGHARGPRHGPRRLRLVAGQSAGRVRRRRRPRHVPAVRGRHPGWGCAPARSSRLAGSRTELVTRRLKDRLQARRTVLRHPPDALAHRGGRFRSSPAVARGRPWRCPVEYGVVTRWQAAGIPGRWRRRSIRRVCHRCRWDGRARHLEQPRGRVLAELVARRQAPRVPTDEPDREQSGHARRRRSRRLTIRSSSTVRPSTATHRSGHRTERMSPHTSRTRIRPSTTAMRSSSSISPSLGVRRSSALLEFDGASWQRLAP